MEQEIQPEPTLSDIMAALTSVIHEVRDLGKRMVEQEEAIAEMQPRLSILYDQEVKSISSPEDGKSNEASDRDSNEGSPVYPEETMPAQRPARKSIFQKNIEETSVLAERHSVVIQRQTPNHSHIYLTSTDLAEYAQFVNKWFDWEIQHGIKLEPALIVSRNVRNQLMYNNGKTETDFNSLTPSAFCSLMAMETKVFSKVQFAETLKYAMRAVKCLYWDNVRPSTHEKFFQGILRRQKQFLRTFQIMMEANKNYCPDLEVKDFGLAKIFLDTIDRNYNKYILAEIPKVKSYNFRKLSDFLDAYVAKAKEHFEASRSIRLVPYTGDDFKLAQQKTQTSQSSSRFRDNPTAHETSSSQRYSSQRVNFVDVTRDDDTDDSVCPGDSHQPRVSDSDDESAYEDCVDQDTDNPVLDTCHETNSADYSVPCETSTQQLQAADFRSEVAPNSVRGCINYALYGRCFAGDSCKNVKGHNEKIALDTRQWILKKVSTPIEFSKVKHSHIDPQQPRKIVQRDRVAPAENRV